MGVLWRREPWYFILFSVLFYLFNYTDVHLLVQMTFRRYCSTQNSRQRWETACRILSRQKVQWGLWRLHEMLDTS